jgi:hypothetical protein
MSYRLGWVLCLLAGCGATAPIPTASEGPLPIWTADPSGAAFGAPRTRVMLNGHPVDVMIDTGASQHFVLDAAAWAYDVPSAPFGSMASDTNGARFLVRLAEPGSMEIAGQRPSHLFVFDSPPLYRTGVLGGVAPQLLAPAGHATVLDLRAGRLSIVRAERAPDVDRSRVGRACLAGGDVRDGWRYVLPVRVADQMVSLLLDTGARATTIYASSPRVQAVLGAMEGRPPRIPENLGPVRVAGAASVANLVFFAGVPFDVGGTRMEGDLAVGPGETQCGEDGLLGFDLLRHCRVVLTRTDAALRCDPSEPPLHAAPEREREEGPIVLTRIEANAACGETADGMRPTTDVRLPLAFASAVEAYVALTEQIEVNRARIEATCRREGYLEAEIREPVLSRDGDEVSVRFEIDQGRLYTVGEVSVTLVGEDGARSLGANELPWLRTRAGEPYRSVHVEDDARLLSAALTSRGVRVAEAYFGRAPHDNATVDVRIAVGLEGALPEVDLQ